jgi:hypothetical protein
MVSDLRHGHQSCFRCHCLTSSRNKSAHTRKWESVTLSRMRWQFFFGLRQTHHSLRCVLAPCRISRYRRMTGAWCECKSYGENIARLAVRPVVASHSRRVSQTKKAVVGSGGRKRPRRLRRQTSLVARQAFGAPESLCRHLRCHCRQMNSSPQATCFAGTRVRERGKEDHATPRSCLRRLLSSTAGPSKKKEAFRVRSSAGQQESLPWPAPFVGGNRNRCHTARRGRMRRATDPYAAAASRDHEIAHDEPRACRHCRQLAMCWR